MKECNLRLHTVVAVGKVTDYVVGGYGGGQWLQTLVGDPLDQVAACIDHASPGKVVISSQARKVGMRNRLL